MMFRSLFCIALLGNVEAKCPWRNTLHLQESALSSDGVLHFQGSGKAGNMLHAVNLDGTAKWSFKLDLPEDFYFSGRIQFVEGLKGTTYVISKGANSTLYALNGLDGSIQWQLSKSSLDAAGVWIGGIQKVYAADDGGVYWLSSDRPLDGPHAHQWRSTLEAFDTTGGLKWSSNVNAQFDDLFLSDVGLMMVTSNYEDDPSRLYLLRPEDGVVKWRTLISEHHKPIFDEDGNVFILAWTNPFDNPFAAPGSLSRLSGESGAVLWEAPLPGLTWSSQMLLNCNGEVYVDLETEDQVFDFDGNFLRALPKPNKERRYISARSKGDGTEEDVFVTCSCQSMLAYSGTDGSVLWNASLIEISGGACHSARIRQPVVFFGQDDHTILSLAWGGSMARRDGKELWTSKVDDAESAIVADDGTTYLTAFPLVSWKGNHRQLLTIVAVGQDGIEKWRYSPEPVYDVALV